MIPYSSSLIMSCLVARGVDCDLWQEEVVPYSLATSISRAVSRCEDIRVENSKLIRAFCVMSAISYQMETLGRWGHYYLFGRKSHTSYAIRRERYGSETMTKDTFLHAKTSRLEPRMAQGNFLGGGRLFCRPPSWRAEKVRRRQLRVKHPPIAQQHYHCYIEALPYMQTE